MSWQRKAGAVIVALVALAAVVSLVWTPYDPLQTCLLYTSPSPRD